MNEPETHPVVEAVQAGFARSDRVFWLDGGGSRDWAGRRSLFGVLDEDDATEVFADERLAFVRRADPVEDDGLAARLEAADSAVDRRASADAKHDVLRAESGGCDEQLARAVGGRSEWIQVFAAEQR